jgi:hypothetical protein
MIHTKSMRSKISSDADFLENYRIMSIDREIRGTMSWGIGRVVLISVPESEL